MTLNELVAGFVKIDEFSLAAKKRRRRAEITADRTSDRWNQDGRGARRASPEGHSHDAGSISRIRSGCWIGACSS